jgi:hypothetical protein
LEERNRKKTTAVTTYTMRRVSTMPREIVHVLHEVEVRERVPELRVGDERVEDPRRTP